MGQHNIINPSTQSTLQHQHAAVAEAFHHPNGFLSSATPGPSSDVQMVSLNGTSYTSLRDLLPSLASPAHDPFPRPPSYDSAWCEIPIKNPLVKHAAIAYLQPMSSAPAVAEGKGILGAITDRCRYGCCDFEDEDGGFCCFWWLGDFVARVARRAGLGWDGPNDNYTDDDDEDDDDDDEEDGREEICEVVESH